MIKLFFYDNFNDISEYFQEEMHSIPFLGDTLFGFVVESYHRFSKTSNIPIKIYTPETWPDIGQSTYTNLSLELSESEYDIVFISDLSSVPVLDITTEDYHFIKQNPDKLFSHPSGFKVGYINKDSKIDRIYTEELQGFSGFIKLSMKNFLKINQALINNVSSEAHTPGTYGFPVILAPKENISNSKIYGPSFIGKDVRVFNSTIYPGSIILGTSVVKNSEIFESFIFESSIKNGTLKNSLSVQSDLEALHLEDSLLPKGSVLMHDGKR